jgi:cytochrome P450
MRLILCVDRAHTNSIKATFWTILYVLATRIREETSKAFPEDSSAPRILSTTYLLNSCPLLTSTVNEVLRLTATPSSTHAVDEDTIVNGYLLRKGARILAPTSHLHSSSFWGSDASYFNPERYLKDASLDKTSNGNFRPFGGGVTYCPGRFLAKQETAITLALMLDRYEMDLVGGAASFPLRDAKKPTLGVIDPADSHMVKIKIQRRST